ncbi:SDR family NAD(P)-dependent oxidoreductase [Chloroflexota bacterium]
MKLEGRVAIVTGAASGIGRAITLTFAREGAYIVINDIDLEKAESLVREIEHIGGRATAIKADVSNSAEVYNMVQYALTTFGSIGVLVNNAAINRSTPTVNLPEAEWDAHMNLNLKGPFLCCQAVGQHMIEQGRGKIINIASVSGHRGVPAVVAYSASKGGVLALTRSLAVEWATHGINVNSVSPGPTMTPMLEKLIEESPSIFADLVKRIPFRRMNQVQDIANAVLFLASSDSDNITGQDIIVDGGSHALHPVYTLP